jgi:hypothetical protein
MSLAMYNENPLNQLRVTGTDRGFRDAECMLAFLRGEQSPEIKQKHRYYNLADPEQIEAHDSFVNVLRLPYPSPDDQPVDEDMPEVLTVGLLGKIQRQIIVHDLGVGVCYYARQNGEVT